MTSATRVSVQPDEFQFVAFDAAFIASVTEQMATALGIDRPVAVVIDETTPLAKVRIELGDTITLHIDSGALEDTRKPRQQSETAIATTVGKALLRCRDRLTGGFGESPDDDALDMRQRAAWDTYCISRLARMGVPVMPDRWRYHFRNRHGFTNLSDTAFDRVWSSDALTWAELESISLDAATKGAIS